MHNIRIERLWLDVTNGFGAKWKELFRQLEALYGLNTDHDAHIWLLHHLFLEAINCDAEQWAASWNHHVVSRRGDRHMTPAQMYIQGIARHGQRGVLPPTGPILEPEIDVNRSSDEDYADYGIDWTEMDQSRIRAHHDTYNLDDGDPTVMRGGARQTRRGARRSLRGSKSEIRREGRVVLALRRRGARRGRATDVYSTIM